MLEVWKSVVGYEGLYQVSNKGRVKSLPRAVNAPQAGGIRMSPGKILKPGNAHGRWLVSLSKQGQVKSCWVAHLVAEAFLGPNTNGSHVLHKNDVATDDRVENLRYGTHQENMADGKVNKKFQRGSKRYNAKLTEQQVIQIKLRLPHEKVSKIAKAFGVSHAVVSMIKSGNNWGWLN